MEKYKPKEHHKYVTPEVKAPVDTQRPSLLVACPVYHIEWTNGNLQRHMQSYFTQRLPKSESLEVNYIINYQRPDNGIDKKQDPAYQVTKRMRGFLDTITHAQALKIEIEKLRTQKGYFGKKERINNITHKTEQLVQLLESEQDSTVKATIQQAIDMAGKINISFIDISEMEEADFHQLGYSWGGKVRGSLRTFGIDYARQRQQQSPERVYQQSDVDTYPSSHHYSHSLIEFYKNNPSAPFLYSRFAFSLPGDTDTVFSKSPYVQTSVIDYFMNFPLAATWQMSFRSSFLGEKGLPFSGLLLLPTSPTTIDYQAADVTTSMIGRAALPPNIDTNYVFPADVLVTMDRAEGFYMGKVAREKFSDVAMYDLLLHRSNFLQRVTQDPKKGEIDYALLQARKKYTKTIEKQERIVRQGAYTFLDAIDNGKITNTNGEISVGKDLHSDSLNQYIQRNSAFLSQLTVDDITWIRYLIGQKKHVLCLL